MVECATEAESELDNALPNSLPLLALAPVCSVQGQDVPCQVSEQWPVSITQGRLHLK